MREFKFLRKHVFKSMRKSKIAKSKSKNKGEFVLRKSKSKNKNKNKNRETSYYARKASNGTIERGGKNYNDGYK